MRELFDLQGVDDRRFSPFCWKAKMALAHKGLDFQTVPIRFCDKDKLAFSGQTRVPVLRDGDIVVFDSWKISCYLEDSYPDRPSLFGDRPGETAGQNLCRFFDLWADGNFVAKTVELVAYDIFSVVLPEDRAYYRQSREKFFKRTLEELAAERTPERVTEWRKLLDPVRTILTDTPFIGGGSANYADYILFGIFQWLRGVTAYPMIEVGDPVHAWREKLLDLFGGLGKTLSQIR